MTKETMPIADSRVPVSVVVGFLGSGKTTLLNHLLTERHGQKIAVIVNDFSELNIDARLVHRSDERLVEMSNGCICCTLREDLLRELRALADIAGLEYILIESTGIGEPMPIAQTFYMEDLPERVRLDSIVTVVDSSSFWRDYERSDVIEDAEGNPTTSSLAPLLVDQLEFTNVVLLNKTDKAEAEAVHSLEGFIKRLNPGAHIYRTSFGAVDPACLIDTGLYDYETGMEAEGWETEWANDGGEAEAYGFSSFVYRQAEPLVWQKFLRVFEAWPLSVIRAKGFVAFADHNPVLLSLAAEDLRLEELQAGELSPEAAAALSPEERLAYDKALAEQADGIKDEVGATEIVLIGRNMPEAELRRLFDACVLTGRFGA
ncbi:MAG: GTP-binding protein [Deinococcota bacterium]|nr:GTP-binding protein [Deinococcota bacterium]